MIPIGDPQDGFFYPPPLTLMLDSYNLQTGPLNDTIKDPTPAHGRWFYYVPLYN